MNCIQKGKNHMLKAFIQRPTLATIVDNKCVGLQKQGFEKRTISVMRFTAAAFDRSFSPNRRDFYNIMYISKGSGIFSLGLKHYHITQPTVLYLRPTEIVSWRQFSTEIEGYICCFTRDLTERHRNLQTVIDRYGFFSDPGKSVVGLTAGDLAEIDDLFERMYRVDAKHGGSLAEDAMQAWLQLLMISNLQAGMYPEPDAITDEFGHVHAFFRLLEEETANVNYRTPIRIKTVKQFADKLFIHPSHLNVLLKKHTGLNVSTHIKKRLLEESKTLLLQTDWTLGEISYAIGFSDQPNFSQFFKKRTGVAPALYRRINALCVVFENNNYHIFNLNK